MIQMRKFFLLLTFLLAAPAVFLVSTLLFLSLSFHYDPQTPDLFGMQEPKKVAYAALPTNDEIFTQEIIASDARTEAIRQFLARYNSPLEPFSQHIVTMAEKYDLDYRLIPAIAMQESNLCKKIPHNSHNCWGFGIYGGKILRFDNYSEAIETVTKTLANKYKQKGLVTPEQIMSKYTPGSNGSWAYGVNHFMEKME
jgi:hypothetical protein